MTFSIKTPNSVAYLSSKHGARIYAKKPLEARKLKKVCDQHEKVWFNDKPIKLSKDEIIKIPLIDGY